MLYGAAKAPAPLQAANNSALSSALPTNLQPLQSMQSMQSMFPTAPQLQIEFYLGRGSYTVTIFSRDYFCTAKHPSMAVCRVRVFFLGKSFVLNRYAPMCALKSASLL